MDEWAGRFEANASRLLPIPWDSPVRLSGAERAAVARSLATFQLGETGTGSFLLRHASAQHDPMYTRAVELFVAEEQRHARDLGRFMDLEEIPRLRHHWTNWIFRRIRKLMGLRLCLTVLMTAELVACVYYRALRDATASPVLRTICAQILRDERPHVEFHAALFDRLDAPALIELGWAATERMLLEATCLVVWCGHRTCLRAGGCTFPSFRAQVLKVRRMRVRPGRRSGRPICCS